MTCFTVLTGSRRHWLALPLAAVVAITATTASQAQSTYPNKTITMVVGFAPGGLIDSIARLVAQKMQQKLGVTVVVENRAGAAGNIAHRRVALAEPDGYTILGGTTSLPINETLYPKRGYTAEDFATISIAATSPEMISAPASGAKTLKDYLDASRVAGGAQFGTAGAGSASFIVTQYFLEKVVKMPSTHIPYQGGAPAVTAAIGNQIPLVAAPPAGGVVPPIKSGMLRALAIAADKRMVLLPDVPTYKELGYPDMVASAWTGFFVPAKTPADIVGKLNATVNEILKDPDVAKRLEEFGFEPLTLDQKAADALFRDDIQKWRARVDAINFKVD